MIDPWAFIGPLVLFCGCQFGEHRYCFLPAGHVGEHGDLPREEIDAFLGSNDWDAITLSALERRRMRIN